MKRSRFHFFVVFLLLALGATSGCQHSKAPRLEPLVARFYLETYPSEEGRTVVLPQSDVMVVVSPKPVVMEFDVVDVEIAEVALGRCLLFKLTLAAGRDLYRLTGSSQGQRLVLALNDQAVGARKIDQPLDETNLMIFLEMPDDALPDVVARLKQTSAEVRRSLAKGR